MLEQFVEYEYEGKKYERIESNNCKKCAFNGQNCMNAPKCSEDDLGEYGNAKNYIFKEVK